MSTTPLLFRLLNPTMKALLWSPFHVLVSSKIMVLSFTGRKSGKQYATPVSYYREDQQVWCFTHSAWWRNFGTGAVVKLRLKGKVYTGEAIAFHENLDLKAETLTKMLAASPGDARVYGVSFDESGVPNQEQVREAAADAVMIQIQLLP